MRRLCTLLNTHVALRAFICFVLQDCNATYFLRVHTEDWKTTQPGYSNVTWGGQVPARAERGDDPYPCPSETMRSTGRMRSAPGTHARAHTHARASFMFQPTDGLYTLKMIIILLSEVRERAGNSQMCFGN